MIRCLTHKAIRQENETLGASLKSNVISGYFLFFFFFLKLLGRPDIFDSRTADRTQ